MKFRGAIFDFDGTLVESMGIWEKIDNRYLGGRGLEVPKGFGKTISLMTFYQVAEYVKELFGLEDSSQKIYEDWLEVALDAYKTEVFFKPNVIKGIEFLYNQGVKMAIATASERVIIEGFLKAYDIDRYISVITTTSEVKASKESGEVYLQAAKQLGFEVGECAVFEDILLGIKTAKAEGFLTVGVADSYSAKDHEAMKNESDFFVEDFIEIMGWF